MTPEIQGMPDGAQFTDGGQTGRTIRTRYQDPLDALWIAASRRLGWTIERSSEVYAYWNGVDTLTVTSNDHYDPDDQLSQFIFHEICHCLVEGLGNYHKEDWGLSNLDPDVWVREAACHRLQAALADRYGLREFLAITGANRDYYDNLPADPLRDGPDPAIPMAQRGWLLSRTSPWREVMDDLLEATARLAATLQPFPLEPDSHWNTALPVHPLKFGPGTGEHTCQECAWFVPGKRNGLCQHALLELRRDRLAPATPACNRYEAVLAESDCGSCGACCREGFSLVPVLSADPIRSTHPEWVVRDQWGMHLPRPQGKCVALCGQGNESEPWRCTAYEDRPHHCRAFEVGGAACLEARRRTAMGP
jgi:hypothetical protein